MANNTRQAPAPIVLLALEGDVEVGATHSVPSDEALPIGRSSRGLRLLDPLVSIQHAQITFDPRRGYVIEDLDSATGTWVDEECIRADSRPIGVGTQLRFGDSVFEVIPLRREYPWLRIGLMMVLTTIAFTLLLLLGFSSVDRPVVPLPKDTFVGMVQLDTLEVPDAFLRTRGVSLRQVQVQEVTDHDDDNIPEVWLQLGDRGTAVITFEANGGVAAAVAGPGGAASGVPVRGGGRTAVPRHALWGDPVADGAIGL